MNELPNTVLVDAKSLHDALEKLGSGPPAYSGDGAPGDDALPQPMRILIDASRPGEMTITCDEPAYRCLVALPCTGFMAPFCIMDDGLADLLIQMRDKGWLRLGREEGPPTGQILTIAGDGVTARLHITPAEEFPTEAPVEAFTHTWTMEQMELNRLLSMPLHASSVEEARFYLNSVFLHAIDGDDGPMLRAVATDGHRLASIEGKAPPGMEGFAANIPSRSVEALIRLLVDGSEHPAVVKSNEAVMEVAARDWRINVKLHDTATQRFPDYRRVIPDMEGVPLAVVQPFKLAKLIFAVAAAARANTVGVEFTRGADRRLVLEAEGERGKIAVEVPQHVARWNDDDDAKETCFQARYLADACGAMPMGFTMFLSRVPASRGGPIAVSGAARLHAEKRTYVLMPIARSVVKSPEAPVADEAVPE